MDTNRRLLIVHRCARRGKSRGFTLLELLVAMTLLSLIVTVGFSALNMGRKSWAAASHKVEENTQVRGIHNLLRSKLSQHYPLVWYLDGKAMLSFFGDESGFKFIGPSPLGREVGEYFEYYVRLEKREEEFSLILNFAPHVPGSDGFSVSEESAKRELLSGLKSGRLLYHPAATEKDLHEPQLSWSEEEKDFPEMVELEIQPFRGGPSYPKFMYLLRSDTWDSR